MVLYETLGATCGPFVFYSVPSMLFAFMIYSEAFFLDIKSLFVQVDRLSDHRVDEQPQSKDSHLPEAKCQKSKLLMLERCKKIVEFHQRVNRYSVYSKELLPFIHILCFSDS